MAQARTAQFHRKTSETEIEISLNLDCTPGSGNLQEINISTGIGFLDHVLALSQSSCCRLWTILLDVHGACKARRVVLVYEVPR